MTFLYRKSVSNGGNTKIASFFDTDITENSVN